MQHLNKAGYIPHGCTYQGRQDDGVHVHPEDYVRQRQEQAADMARCRGAADTESAEDTVQRFRVLPGSAERAHRVILGGVVLLLAVLGAVTLLAGVAR